MVPSSLGVLIDRVRARLVERAVQVLVLVDEVAVQAGGHPQLQRRVERVVGHRARRRRSHLAVRGVDGCADERAVDVGADGRDGQIRSGGPRPFERMLVDVAAVDRALQHAVADTRQRQLHDHVRGGQQHGGGIQQVGDPGGAPLHLSAAAPAMGSISRVDHV